MSRPPRTVALRPRCSVPRSPVSGFPRHAGKRLAVRLLAVLLLTTAPWLSHAAAEGTTVGDDGQPDVVALIQQLGSPSYAARVRARETLERIGLQAFDHLHAAQYHADSEIALTARYLVSSLLVSWSTDSDPPAVRETLDEYGAQSEAERQNRIDHLAELPEYQGLEALVRLARFERSLRLSNEAALAVMRMPLEVDDAHRQTLADRLLDVLGGNQRQAAQWLRVYGEDLRRGGYSAAAWRQLITAQRQGVDEGTDTNASRPMLLELVRVCAQRARDLGRVEEALELASTHLDLISPRSRDLIEACGWAIDNDLHPLVLELQSRHGDAFDRHPILLYGAAEATKVIGDEPAAAELLAARAAALDPLPQPDSEAAEAMSPKSLEERAHRHRETGRELQSRGLFHWAEREFRHIIDSLPLNARAAVSARQDLASMLGELNRHQQVVEVLEPLVRRAEADQQFAQKMEMTRLKSMLLYHRGLAAAAQGGGPALDDARQSLQAALELDKRNIDILIAMYRLDGDQRWQADVRRRIEAFATMFENLIQMNKAQAQAPARFPNSSGQLADFYNQYAWLISNTEGDQERALRYSKRSLELVPDNPALLDTCGRCYFAIGDLDAALRTQRRAVKLQPHSPPLVRQLAEFEAAAESAKQD